MGLLAQQVKCVFFLKALGLSAIFRKANRIKCAFFLKAHRVKCALKSSSG